MASNNFFRPSFWDLLGAATGIIGLGGLIKISYTMPSAAAGGMVASAGLMAVGSFALRAWLFTRDFPFRDVEHNTVLIFRIVEEEGESRVVARQKRETSFRPRFRGWRTYDRKQFLTEPSGWNSDSAVAGLNHTFKAYMRSNPFSKDWQRLHSVKRSARISDFRQAIFEFEFPEDVKGYAQKYRIEEEMDLQNDFNQALEFYDIQISEPAKMRNVRLVFEGFEINSSWVYFRHGSRKSKAKALTVEKVDGRVGCEVNYQIKGARVGSTVSLQWDWAGIDASKT